MEPRSEEGGGGAAEDAGLSWWVGRLVAAAGFAREGVAQLVTAARFSPVGVKWVYRGGGAGGWPVPRAGARSVDTGGLEGGRASHAPRTSAFEYSADCRKSCWLATKRTSASR